MSLLDLHSFQDNRVTGLDPRPIGRRVFMGETNGEVILRFVDFDADASDADLCLYIKFLVHFCRHVGNCGVRDRFNAVDGPWWRVLVSSAP